MSVGLLWTHISIFAFETYADEHQAQQDILLQIYELAERLQIEFAFPTQTIQIQK